MSDPIQESMNGLRSKLKGNFTEQLKTLKLLKAQLALGAKMGQRLPEQEKLVETMEAFLANMQHLMGV